MHGIAIAVISQYDISIMVHNVIGTALEVRKRL